MAIKGNAYTKTTWAFEERPVASSKLNLWDDRIEAGQELLHFFLGHAWSGVDGVLRGVTAGDLDVKATTAATLSVDAQPGHGLIDNFASKGSADIRADFTFAYPLTAFVEILGLPAADVGDFHNWGIDLTLVTHDPGKGIPPGHPLAAKNGTPLGVQRVAFASAVKCQLSLGPRR